MKIVVFGLAISSSWGNGHATLWRGLVRALGRRGHHVTFFERDVPYYAQTRDIHELPGGALMLYPDWASIADAARRAVAEADVAMVTSYCPDATEAERLVLGAPRATRLFYDLDTPVTLAAIDGPERPAYVGPRGFADYDLVLSYTGGAALTALRDRLGARRVAPLYGHVDPDVHRPTTPKSHVGSALTYLGTYAADRQPALERLFVEPARLRPDRRFTIGGAQYPADFPWTPNIFFLRHLPPADHAAFYASGRMTLNVTRAAMAAMGYCPSGRLFEAAACGTALLSDAWDGLDAFFTPGEDILVASATAEALAALDLDDAAVARIARNGRDRVLADHTSDTRAAAFEAAVASLAADDAPHHDRMGPLVQETPVMWGIVPAAGRGSRIQPLAFSKELLPVGSRLEAGVERPCAVSEYLLDRMVAAGATKICFVISPGKSDILAYYGGGFGPAAVAYVVQPNPSGLCDAIFRAAPLIGADEPVIVGLPDTVWFPETGFVDLPDGCLSFLLFPVERPEFFDAVVCDADGGVSEIQVKRAGAASNWIWGGFKMPGRVLHALHDLWRARDRQDEYIGTLVNAYIAAGGAVQGVKAGTAYVDVGTLNGYRAALGLLGEAAPPIRRAAPLAHHGDGPPILATETRGPTS